MAAGAETTKTSNAGIVTNEETGQRLIPASVRADGSLRKEIKIKPGYRPPEDIGVYKNRAAHAFQSRGKAGIPGAEGLKDNSGANMDSTWSNKNAKRREARNKAKSDNTEESDKQKDTISTDKEVPDTADTKKESVLSKEEEEKLEKEKKVRKLTKKLREAKELQSKKEKGEKLLHEQFEKVIKINELIRDLEKLGFDKNANQKEETKD